MVLDLVRADAEAVFDDITGLECLIIVGHHRLAEIVRRTDLLVYK
jgi:hypothetical protein